MKKYIYSLLGIMVLALALVTPTFAAVTKNIAVTATVPTLSGGMNVTISRIRASDDVWESSSSTNPIAFGTLALDSVNNIFTSSYYYAVDVGVTDNSGTVWTLTHTRTSIANGANNLDSNVNVTFMKQTSATATTTELRKVTYLGSNNIAYTKTQLNGGWLRIYYGIATGSGDASGASPIGLDKVAGTYTGQATITLSP